MARLREGRANTARGAAHFLRGRWRGCATPGRRGSSRCAPTAASQPRLVAVCRALDVRFSVTIRQQPNVRTLIAIAEEDWTPIPYWLAAETTYTPFQHKEDATPVRLIVRRVGSQLALFVNYSYHAFITDRAGEMMELEAGHRRHAEIENAIRDLKYGVGLNHLRRFAANAAWLAVQVSRTTSPLDGAARARRDRDDQGSGGATSLSPTLTHSARRWTLHLGPGLVSSRAGAVTTAPA